MLSLLVCAGYGARSFDDKMLMLFVCSEALVRAGFQCVQAVVSDHLRNISFDCIEQCAVAATKFGTQPVDLNVSLTAISVLVSVTNRTVACI